MKMRMFPLRFTLKTLALLLVCFALGFWKIGTYYNYHENKLRAIAEMRPICLMSDNDYEEFNGFFATAVSWFTPLKYREQVRSIDLMGEETTSGRSLKNFNFKNLKYFPELERLNIYGDATEPQLLEIQGIKDVATLKLRSPISDKVLRHFSGICPSVRELVIDGEQVTAENYDEICKFTNLEDIFLNIPEKDKPAILKLRSLKKLKHIFIQNEYVLTKQEMQSLKDKLPIGWE